MQIYKHQELNHFLKHIKGIIYEECDLNGNTIIAKRSWLIRSKSNQRRIVRDTNKLISIETNNKQLKIEL